MRFRVAGLAVVATLAAAGAACSSSGSTSSPSTQAPATASTEVPATVSTQAPVSAPASVSQAASEAEVDLTGIDTALRTADSEQATVDSGLSADEPDPTK